MLSGSIIDSGGLKAPYPRELSAVRLTEGVNKYFACAYSPFAKFMTAEELVSLISKKSPLAHISRAARRISQPKAISLKLLGGRSRWLRPFFWKKALPSPKPSSTRGLHPLDSAALGIRGVRLLLTMNP